MQCLRKDSVGAGGGRTLFRSGFPGGVSAAQIKVRTVSPNPVQCGDDLSLRLWGGGGAEGLELDIRELLRALPSKTDIQQLISAVEQSCQQAVEGLREDTLALGHRVETLENGHEAMMQVVEDIQDTTKYHAEVLNSYKDQLDDYENRDRRQNICIKGLPETIRASELLPTVQELFHKIMGNSVSEGVEIDSVHCFPSCIIQNAERPRDIICKLHTFPVKESIMKNACSKSEIIFDGVQGILEKFEYCTKVHLFH